MRLRDVGRACFNQLAPSGAVSQSKQAITNLPGSTSCPTRLHWHSRKFLKHTTLIELAPHHTHHSSTCSRRRQSSFTISDPAQILISSWLSLPLILLTIINSETDPVPLDADRAVHVEADDPTLLEADLAAVAVTTIDEANADQEVP
jgi:hypothetical protein